LGGRAGYFLFYKPATLLSDPLEFFNLLGGGMASHGGILGLIAFTFYYARRHKVSWPAVGDGLVVVAPIGLALGRIANFINGELYGRITTSTKWAVIFPDSLREPNSLGDHTSEAWNAIIDAEPRIDLTTPDRISQVVTYVRDNPELKTVLATYLAPRHPSQLYEALFEGILLFAVLFAIRCYYKKLAPGILTGLFFVLYAVARIFVEHYREPDADLILDLTRGQFYSTFMIFIGIAFITYGFVAKKKHTPSNS
ncbi:MAG: prolipoprotein diacylglyceryl transferase, partial [Verrucomicrobiales bacterium]|nr:prolipoprotein diacylglyceryl transferase [Verrucomicrobiales bacterium]